jgi:hypothetical protein
MRPYRILSVGWMTLCVLCGIVALIKFQNLRWLYEDRFTESLFWSGCAILIYALGAVASIFLDRRIFWSRMAVCIVAFFSAMVCGLALLEGGSPRWLTALLAFIVFYSWLSIIVLLIPKRYVA